LILQTDGDWWHDRDPERRSDPQIAANIRNDRNLNTHPMSWTGTVH
jgi:hypothetical protein